MSVVAASLLALISLAFMRLDRLIWGTAYTPGVVLSFGYAIVAIIYALAEGFYPFVEVRWTTFAGLALCLCACMICSALAAFVIGWRNSEFEEVEFRLGAAPLILLLVTLTIYLPLAVDRSLASGGFWLSDARVLMGRGLVGHIHVLLAFALVWFSVAGTVGYKLRLPLILLSLVALSLYPVKGWTLIPLLAIVFGQQTGPKNSRMGWVFLPIIGISGMVVFFSIYAASGVFLHSSTLDTMLAIFDHFIFYITAGLFGMDAVFSGLHLSGGLEKLFAPIYNVLAILSGDGQVSHLSDIYVVGLLDVRGGANVYSFFGSTIGYGGNIRGLAVAFVILLFGYLIFAIGRRSRNSALWAYSLYIMAAFAFGSFEYYFWLLTVYEIGFIALLFALPTMLSKTRTS